MGKKAERGSGLQRVKCRRTETVLVMAILLSLGAAAQETVNEYETWMRFKLSYDPLKQLKIHVEPELRFNNDFSIDKYMIEGGARYELFNLVKLGAAYRFIGNKRVEKDTEYLHRYALDAGIGKKIRRFQPEARIQYTNFSDEDLDGQYLRYKLELEYDIPSCKITPFVWAQAYQKLSINRLYKMRYAAGAEYQFMKNNYVGLFYKFDYYRLEYRNKHILGITYRMKL